MNSDLKNNNLDHNDAIDMLDLRAIFNSFEILILIIIMYRHTFLKSNIKSVDFVKFCTEL